MRTFKSFFNSETWKTSATAKAESTQGKVRAMTSIWNRNWSFKILLIIHFYSRLQFADQSFTQCRSKDNHYFVNKLKAVVILKHFGNFKLNHQFSSCCAPEGQLARLVAHDDHVSGDEHHRDVIVDQQIERHLLFAEPGQRIIPEKNEVGKKF